MTAKATISQYRLAKLSGLSQAAISLIVNGKRVPRPSTARRLEQVTGISRHIWRDGDGRAIRAALSRLRTLPPPARP